MSNIDNKRRWAGVDILLVNAPHFNVIYPPSGIAYLCESVRSMGLVPAVFDLNNELIMKYRQKSLERFWHVERSISYWMGEDYSEVEKVFGDDFNQAAEIIAKSDARIVGFSVNMLNLKTTDKIAARVRELSPDKTILYGGYSCYHDEVCQTLSDRPDYVCVGESEGTIISLIKALLFDDGDPAEVAGVMTPGDKDKKFRPVARSENLDELLWPTWQEFDLDNYKTLQPFVTVSVNASRGCAWGRCHFCSDWGATPGFRRRSAESLVEEIGYSVKENNVTYFHLSDLIVNGDHAELEHFCDLVLKSGLKIIFSGQFHIDKRLTKELLHKLKNAGMPIINFGLETGSDKVMKLMRKGHNIKLAERCLSDATDTGLITDVNLLVGYPGETMEDIYETEAFFRRNRDKIDIVEVVNICSIQYGSPLWELKENFGVEFDPIPGTREERQWVSSDGTNTFEERVRRATYLQNVIEELGIGKGYHSQEFSFNGDGANKFDTNIYGINLADSLAGKKDVLSGENILLLRSCPMQQFELLCSAMISTFDKADISVLCQQSAVSKLAENFANNLIHSYDAGAIDLDIVPESLVEALRTKEFKAVFVPYGEMPKWSYRNVLRLAHELGTGKVYTISVGGAISVYTDNKVSDGSKV